MLSRWIGRFAPNLGGVRRTTFAPDLLAGLTVAALAIPQGLAYALIAGCPAEMGLAAAALPTATAALFGSSRFQVSGPTNPISLLVGSAVVAPAMAAGISDPVPRVLATAWVAGLLLVGFGIAGIGRASRFLSDSVVVGFATGAGLLIALGILPKLAGDTPPLEPAGGFVPAFWPHLEAGIRSLMNSDARTLALAAGVPAIVLCFRRVSPRVPAALLAIALASIVCFGLGWSEGEGAVATLGPLSLGWPDLHAPPLPDPETVLPPALAIAILATLQSIAAARTVAPASGPRFDPDRELFAQGVANLTTSVVGGIPTCGSLSRSAQLRAAGGRTRFASVASGIAMALCVLWLSTWLAYIPLAALVGLVVLSGIELIDPRTLRRATATRSDALVLVATLAATLMIDLVQALYAGLFFSLALLVRRAGRLQLSEIVRAGGERFREIAVDARTGTHPAVLLHLEGDLNFAIAPELHDRLSEITARGPRVLLLRLKHARHVDATVLETLRQAACELRAGGGAMLVCGLTEGMARALESSELAKVVGREGLLRAGTRLYEGFERALTETRRRLAPLADEEIFRGEPAPSDPSPIEDAPQDPETFTARSSVGTMHESRSKRGR